MVAARSLGREQADPNQQDYSGQTVIVPTYDYNLSQTSCNTLVNTVLYQNGFGTLADNLPKVGGDTGGGAQFGYWRFPGGDSILGSTADQTFDLTDHRINSVLDQGGSDTYIINATVSQNLLNLPVRIFEDRNPSTLDRIIIQNANPSDIRFVKEDFGDLSIRLPGKPFAEIIIQDQWEDGVPKVNTVWVYPPGGDDLLALDKHTTKGYSPFPSAR